MEDEMPLVRVGPLGQLMCPECGGENLHQGQVEVYVRDEEDSQHGIAANIFPTSQPSNAHLSVSTDVSAVAGNPSARRDGISIEFTCEACPSDGYTEILFLHIYQHKGTTFVEWGL